MDDKFRSEALKLVNEKFSPKEVYAELDRRSRVLKESQKILEEEVPELLSFVNDTMPNPDKEFEERLANFRKELGDAE